MQSLMRRVAALAGTALAAATITGAAEAAVIYECDGMAGADGASSCSLESLIRNDGFVIVGDKKFHSWSYATQSNDFILPSTTVSGAGYIYPIFGSGVQVTGLDDGGDFGLRFQNAPGTNPWYASVNGTGEALLSTRFRYTVEVLDPNFQIVGSTIELTQFNLEVDTDKDGIFGSALVQEHEGYLPEPDFSDNQLVGKIAGDVMANLDESLDSLVFDPTTSRMVTTTVSVYIHAEAHTASAAVINAFEERFSQIQVAVPEPGTIALLGAALAALGFARRRARI